MSGRSWRITAAEAKLLFSTTRAGRGDAYREALNEDELKHPPERPDEFCSFRVSKENRKEASVTGEPKGYSSGKYAVLKGHTSC